MPSEVTLHQTRISICTAARRLSNRNGDLLAGEKRARDFGRDCGREWLRDHQCSRPEEHTEAHASLAIAQGRTYMTDNLNLVRALPTAAAWRAIPGLHRAAGFR